LGRIEKELSRAINEGEKRLPSKAKDKDVQRLKREIDLAGRVTRISFPPKKTQSFRLDPQKKARQLKGQPAGHGLASGKARIILDAAELYQVRKGEVLVCDSIDPNMTFVVPLAAAIVERRGGMLIHGAIIAREYGIPCVTGVPNVTSLIQTGDVVTVDGFLGIIAIEKKSEGVDK
jgi:pyruvate,water dikinase